MFGSLPTEGQTQDQANEIQINPAQF